MDPEAWTIIGVGIVLAGIVLASARSAHGDIKRLEERFEQRFSKLEESNAGLRERMAKLEGLLEGLREAVTGRNRPPVAGD